MLIQNSKGKQAQNLRETNPDVAHRNLIKNTIEQQTGNTLNKLSAKNVGKTKTNQSVEPT